MLSVSNGSNLIGIRAWRAEAKSLDTNFVHIICQPISWKAGRGRDILKTQSISALRLLQPVLMLQWGVRRTGRDLLWGKWGCDEGDIARHWQVGWGRGGGRDGDSGVSRRAHLQNTRPARDRSLGVPIVLAGSSFQVRI